MADPCGECGAPIDVGETFVRCTCGEALHLRCAGAHHPHCPAARDLRPSGPADPPPPVPPAAPTPRAAPPPLPPPLPPPPGTSHTAVEVAGTFTSGFETSDFVAVGSPELWWAYFTGSVHEDWLIPSWTEVGFWSQRVVVSGLVSPPGSYGHLGGCRRELAITGIRSVDEHSFRSERPGAGITRR